MYALSQHPDVARRLRAEVLEHVGPARRPDFEDLKEMKYLRAFLNGALLYVYLDPDLTRVSETLRLFPVVYVVLRFKPVMKWLILVVLIQPFRCSPKHWGSHLAISRPDEETLVSASSHEDNLFCIHDAQTERFVGRRWYAIVVVIYRFMMRLTLDVAEEFDPDRFLDERLKKYLLKNSFIFLPFNAGPRICLGQQVCISFHDPLRRELMNYNYSMLITKCPS